MARSYRRLSNSNNDKPFIENTGVQRNATHVQSPIEVFKLYITDEIVQQIINEISRYHNHTIDPGVKWDPITPGEFYAYFWCYHF